MKKSIILLIGLCFINVARTQTLLDRKYYVTSFDCQHSVPQWSAYILDNAKLMQNTPRYPTFFSDDSLNCTQATNNDYDKSGYDKGHLAPADDFRFSLESERSAFYLTNVAPQFPSFNRAQWEHLEVYVRKLAQQNDSLLVITGIIFNSYSKWIGNNIYIPDYYFKVVYIYKTNQTLCYRMPNVANDGEYPNYSFPLDTLRPYIQNLPDSLNVLKLQ